MAACKPTLPLRTISATGLLAVALFMGGWGEGAQAEANESIAAPQETAVEQQNARDKTSKEPEPFFQRLIEGALPDTGSYQAPPPTPTLLKLHRPERFGIHLHNVGFRYYDQPTLETSPGQTRDSFQIATTEIEISGSLLPGLLFAQVVMDARDLLGRGLGDTLAAGIDPRNGPSGIVRDAFFDLLLAEPAVFVRVGQQRIPFGIEPQTPGGLLPFINRAYLDLKVTHYAGLENTKFRNAEFVQERDIGIQARGTLFESPSLTYALGAFNGSGINVNDTNNSKDWIGRLGFNPHPGLRLGVSGYKGTQTDLQAESGPRDRVGGDLEFTPALVPRVRLVAEAAKGKEGDFRRRTWYVAGFYELISQRTPTSPGLWLAARYEALHDSDSYSRTTVGLTYYLLNAVNRTTGYWQQIKFQVNDEIRKHPAPTGTPEDAFGENLLLAQITARY